MQSTLNISKAPQLRFKGFLNEWAPVTLENLGVFKKGGALSKADISEEGRPCILYGELYTRYTAVIREVVSKTNTQLKSDVKGYVNDVLIPSSGETAIDIACASALCVENVSLGGDLNLFRPHKDVSGPFISYLINSVQKRNLAKLAQGASVVHLYSESLKKLSILLPCLEEQQKIAFFFSLLDQKIEKQQERIEQLEQFKKGVIQKIFSQQIRFKDDDGSDFSEWETKFLSDFARKITKKNKDFAVRNVISNSSKYGLVSQRDYFDKDIANTENINGYYVISKGDFVYNPRISSDAPYGPVSIYKQNEEGVVSPLYFCFSVTNINKVYLSYYFKSNQWHRHIYLKGDSGARHDRVSIKDTEFLKLKLKVPCPEEQEKIADFFTTLDEKIRNEAIKLEELNVQKRGLMQKMFV
ncbi:restriction endonuclease subunit S [Cytobacillus horneckiae]|uniref:restriction endonuclease subunit S n=1 Tax=Cytobacillus horneckiae TaxID=549687 RepID=UPI003D9AAC1E